MRDDFSPKAGFGVFFPIEWDMVLASELAIKTLIY